MDIINQFLLSIAKSYVIPIILGLACAYFGAWQGRRSLKKREFRNLFNFSLNMIDNGHLKIRTLIEKPSKDVFLMPAIINMVNDAANHTTPEDCLLPIPEKDYWICLNTALNEVSQRFAEGYLREDISGNRQSDIYVMCLTFEVADKVKMKTKKIRAMLIKKSILENFPVENPTTERETHAVRIDTLRQLACSYKDEAKQHCFIEIELSV